MTKRQTAISRHILPTVLVASLAACGSAQDDHLTVDFENTATHAIAANATLIDVMVDDCHMYPTRATPGVYTQVYGSRCSRGARVISTTHETEALGDGDMFGLNPPPDGTYTPSAPWNVTYRPYALDLALDNRSAVFSGRLSNNGRLIYDGYLGTFLNISVGRALSSYTQVHLVFEDQGSALEAGSAARVMLGARAVDNVGRSYVVETNLRIAGGWDYCTSGTGPSSQIKGTPLGLSANQQCDPTSNAVVDYRSYNPGSSELVYLNGPRLLPPVVSGTTTTYDIPVSSLYAALPWKVTGANMRLNGLYFGIEHHHGAKTRVVLKDLRIIDAAPTTSEAGAIERMRQALVVPAVPALKGLLDEAKAVSGGFHLRGWACTEGINGQTLLHVYARQSGTSGLGSYITATMTSGSTSYSTSVCRNSGSNVFDLTLPSSQVTPYLGKEVVIVARDNATGSFAIINSPSPSVTFRADQAPPAPAPAPAPAPVIKGVLDVASPVANGFRLYGWACTVGVSGKTEIHVHAGISATGEIGPWLGTFSTIGSSPYSTSACQNSGLDVFDLTLPSSQAAPYLGKEVVIVARNNATGSFAIINKPSPSVTF